MCTHPWVGWAIPLVSVGLTVVWDQLWVRWETLLFLAGLEWPYLNLALFYMISRPPVGFALVVKAGVIYTGKVSEQKCSVSLEAWAQDSDSVL